MLLTSVEIPVHKEAQLTIGTPVTSITFDATINLNSKSTIGRYAYCLTRGEAAFEGDEKVVTFFLTGEKQKYQLSLLFKIASDNWDFWFGSDLLQCGLFHSLTCKKLIMKNPGIPSKLEKCWIKFNQNNENNLLSNFYKIMKQ